MRLNILILLVFLGLGLVYSDQVDNGANCPYGSVEECYVFGNNTCRNVNGIAQIFEWTVCNNTLGKCQYADNPYIICEQGHGCERNNNLWRCEWCIDSEAQSDCRNDTKYARCSNDNYYILSTDGDFNCTAYDTWTCILQEFDCRGSGPDWRCDESSGTPRCIDTGDPTGTSTTGSGSTTGTGTGNNGTNSNNDGGSSSSSSYLMSIFN